MRTTKIPYEFLARWNQDGALAGAHAQFRHLTRADDGTVIGEFVGGAEPVAAAGAQGFPLADILNEIEIAAITQRDAALAERDVAIAQRDAALARLATLEGGGAA